MSIRFSFGGDEHIFAEVSESMSLEAFFTSLSMTNAVREAGISGVTEICPANASFQIKFDPDRIKPADMLAELKALEVAADTVISQQVARLAVPRRFTQMTREIWTLQERLIKRSPKRALRAFEHPRFRAAYDFLALRASAGEPFDDDVAWWTDFQDADEAAREALLGSAKSAGGGGNGSRRRRRRRKPA